MSFSKNALSRLIFIIPLILFHYAPLVSAQVTLSNSGSADAEPERTFSVDKVSDAALKARLEAIFSHIEDLSKVKVDVEDGVVKLSGTVLRSKSRNQAERLASRLEGVVFVKNEIEEETDIQERVNPAFSRTNEYLFMVIKKLPVIGVALLVLSFSWGLSVLLDRWESPFKLLSPNPLVQNLFRRLSRSIMIFVGFLVALDILDIATGVGALIGTAGIVGLALSFAFRDIVENYLSGILLSIRSPFAVNDLIRIGDYEGKVIRLTGREMVLMTLNGDHVRIPNATVFKSIIYNYTHNPLRRFDFEVGVGVNESLSRVEETGCRTLKKMKGVMEDPGPFMRVENLGDFSVIVRFFGWVDQRSADFLKVKSEAIRLVKAALDHSGIDLPAPIQTVHLVREVRREGASEKSTPEATHSLDEEAEKLDVSVDNQLDKQIEEDLATSDEENFLDKTRS